ncbi:hypothetical protein ACKVMT_07685 [Halobacteriales archaeon Cl-PHB]
MATARSTPDTPLGWWCTMTEGTNALSRTDRRSVLKLLGTGAIAAAGAGLGTMSLTGNAAAASVNITASNPATVANDRGDLSQVTIDPSFRVEWENLDTAVGKVFVLLEGRTIEDGNVMGEGWSPLFRMTPWLTENKTQNGGKFVDYSKPGTTGYYEITGKLSEVMARSVRARNDMNNYDPQYPIPRPIDVVNEKGRPDYSNLNFPGGVTEETFLEGDSVGKASDYDSTTEPLVNNFPGAAAGYYGAAINTDNFDVPKDGSSDSDRVELRYTFALYTVNSSMLSYAQDSVGSGWYEHVRQSDVQSDSQGNSVLVMNGEDGYPDLTAHDSRIGSPAAKHYPSLRSIAGGHPAAITETTEFTVTVENQAADAGATGDSNTGASGGGQ